MQKSTQIKRDLKTNKPLWNFWRGSWWTLKKFTIVRFCIHETKWRLKRHLFLEGYTFHSVLWELNIKTFYLDLKCKIVIFAHFFVLKPIQIYIPVGCFSSLFSTAVLMCDLDPSKIIKNNHFGKNWDSINKWPSNNSIISNIIWPFLWK